MATPVHTVDAQVTPGYPLITETPDVAGIPDPTLQAALRITQSLQTTLDIGAILKLFFQEIAGAVPVDGIEYRHARLELSFTYGKRSRHSCHYDLRMENESLGDLIFRRRRNFGEGELADLEHLLCTLLYPLRNGILYREALSRARKDPLTGICNRAALDDTLAKEVSLAHRHDTHLSLVVIDIDLFKNVNDRFGHSIGDRALCAVVNAAQKCARNSDELFRYGGEEFVILLRNTDCEGAVLMAERLRKQIEKLKFYANDERIRITVSAGATSLTDHDDADSFFRRADAALYEAKADGRNRTARS